MFALSQPSSTKRPELNSPDLPLFSSCVLNRQLAQELNLPSGHVAQSLSMEQSVYARYDHSSSTSSRSSWTQKTYMSSQTITYAPPKRMARSLSNSPIEANDVVSGNRFSFSDLERPFVSDPEVSSVPINNLYPDESTEVTVVIGISSFEFPMAPPAKSTNPKSSRKQKAPSPIEICSSPTELSEPQTAMHSPVLPPKSAPMCGSMKTNPVPGPKRSAPSSPVDRLPQITLAEALNRLRDHPPTPPDSAGIFPHSTSSRKTSKSSQPKSVRFDVLKSPTHSDLKSPTYFGFDVINAPMPSDMKSPKYFGSFRNSISPPAFSPKTPEAMSFDDPSIVGDSPVASHNPNIDNGLMSPLLETVYEDEENQKPASSLPIRGRQVDRETLIRLTGREPSPLTNADEAPVKEQQPAIQHSTIFYEHREAKHGPKIRSAGPLSPHSKGYFPSSQKTDRQSILGVYFNRHDSY